jgi:hypothetical protein
MPSAHVERAAQATTAVAVRVGAIGAWQSRGAIPDRVAAVPDRGTVMPDLAAVIPGLGAAALRLAAAIKAAAA